MCWENSYLLTSDIKRVISVNTHTVNLAQHIAGFLCGRKMFQTKFLGKIRHTVCSFFRKSSPFWRNVNKYGRDRQTDRQVTDNNTVWRIRFARCRIMTTYTLPIYYTILLFHCSSVYPNTPQYDAILTVPFCPSAPLRSNNSNLAPSINQPMASSSLKTTSRGG
jgi:hypothetical protein